MTVIILTDMLVSLVSRYEDRKLRIISMVIALSFLAGGMMIARNMPYKATDNAETTLSGRMFPIMIPKAVPDAQHGTANKKAP